MIIRHQKNISAYAGAYTFYWPTQPIIQQTVSKTSAAAAFALIAQARSLQRFVQSRVFGRIN